MGNKWLTYGLAVVGVLVLGGMLQRSCAWESRARAAERYDAAQRDTIAALETVAANLAAQAARVDTIRVTKTKLIPVVDSISKPDSTCAPSLRARDLVLAADAREIDDLQHEARVQINALARLTADRDTLRAALAARPHGGLTLELLHPTLHLSAVALLYPVQRFGFGVSYDLVSLRL
jgi:hypothetical protein